MNILSKNICPAGVLFHSKLCFPASKLMSTLESSLRLVACWMAVFDSSGCMMDISEQYLKHWYLMVFVLNQFSNSEKSKGTSSHKSNSRIEYFNLLYKNKKKNMLTLLLSKPPSEKLIEDLINVQGSSNTHSRSRKSWTWHVTLQCLTTILLMVQTPVDMVVSPIIYTVLYILGGAGFLPSTVWYI